MREIRGMKIPSVFIPIRFRDRGVDVGPSAWPSREEAEQGSSLVQSGYQIVEFVPAPQFVALADRAQEKLSMAEAELMDLQEECVRLRKLVAKVAANISES